MFTLKKKVCKICGQEFIPSGAHQACCKRPHTRVCPICGKEYVENNLGKFKYPPTTCSMKCRVKKRTQTSLEKYGITAPGNNPDARKKAQETMKERYGVNFAQESKDIRQKSKNTWELKYGVDNPQKCKEIKNKTSSTNIRKYGSKSYLNSSIGKKHIETIMLKKYGTTIPLRNSEILQRQIETNIKRYGYTNPAKAPEVKEKSKQTSLTRYGTEYPQSSETVKQHIREAFIRNYGVDNCFKVPEIIDKIHKTFFEHYGVHSVMEAKEIAEKIKATNLKRYGVPYGIMLPEARAGHTISGINKDIQHKLEQLGIHSQLEYRLRNKSYDIYIPQGNILLEIDPTYTHNILGNHWNPKGISKFYHLQKTLIAQKEGYRCIHLWDWDCISKFINNLIIKYTIYRNISPEIIPIDEARIFCNKYSLYPEVSENIIYIGLKYKTKLINLIGFKLTDPINNIWTIMCIENRFNYSVRGGNKTILKYFIENFKPYKIIAYADFSKTNGELLENMDFKYIKFIMPNKIWSKGFHAIVDSPSIIGEAMILDKWLPVYNCGYKVYELYQR